MSGEPRTIANLEEEARKQEEKEMEDSKKADSEERDREIEHLVLVTRDRSETRIAVRKSQFYK
jgi:hypothetical protein